MVPTLVLNVVSGAPAAVNRARRLPGLPKKPPTTIAPSACTATEYTVPLRFTPTAVLNAVSGVPAVVKRAKRLLGLLKAPPTTIAPSP